MNEKSVFCKVIPEDNFFFCLIGDIIVMVLGHKRSELLALKRVVENIRYLLVWIPDD